MLNLEYLSEDVRVVAFHSRKEITHYRSTYPEARVIGAVRESPLGGGEIVCVVKNYRSGVEAIDAAAAAKIGAKEVYDAARAASPVFWPPIEESRKVKLAKAVAAVISERAHPLIAPDMLSFSEVCDRLPASVGDFTWQAVAAALRGLGWRKFDRATVRDGKHQLWLKGNSVTFPTLEANRRMSSAAKDI